MKVVHITHTYPSQKLIDERTQEILDNFEFHKVHDVMTYLNWHWYTVGGVPTLDDLKRTAEYLLREVTKHPKRGGSISTGGFYADYRVYKNTDDGNWFRLDLSFSIETTLCDDGISF